MIPEVETSIVGYNRFCQNLSEGCILYNIDKTNSWGDYFLVANITTIEIEEQLTYSMLLLGLKKQDSIFVPRDVCIKLTPDCSCNIPFLKYVGRCNFTLVPELTDVSVNTALATIYSEVDLNKYARKLNIRKPKIRKYGKDGKLIIRKTGNKKY